MKREPAFIDLPDGSGKLYVPQPQPGPGKPSCPDCFSCQQCSLDRCAACRPAKGPQSTTSDTEPAGCR